MIENNVNTVLGNTKLERCYGYEQGMYSVT